jgi:virginiamycin B lyase
MTPAGPTFSAGLEHEEGFMSFMRGLVVTAAAAGLAAAAPLPAQQMAQADLREWPVERGGRTRDPYVAPDGKVWFVGQQGNYVGNMDPASGALRYYEIEAGTNPHTLIVDPQGIVWYAGNRNGRIGRLDPATGQIRTFMTGEAQDPHTMVFDGKGHIWFTSQGSNRVGRLTMETGEVRLVTPWETPSNPYGIVMDAEGHPWAMLLRTNKVVRIDPETFELTHFDQASPDSRGRRIAWTEDNKIWYVDEARGYLGSIDVATREAKEWQTPGGPDSNPYAIAKDDQGRIWFSETGPVKQLIGFDPQTEQFFSINSVSSSIRNMYFHAATGTMWFGTDANNVGRIVTRRVVS